MASSIPRTFTPLFSPSHVGSGTKIRGTLASLSAALVLLCASSSNAGDTCTASVEKSPCTAASGGGDDYCCAPGWVFDNNWASSAGSPGGISVTWSSSSMQFTQKYNLNDSCCEALYAGIGNIGSTVVTDTYNQPGSHLPLQLKDIALLKGAWTIQVPPVKSSDIYRVYYEMFLSSTTAGLRDKGNITIDFYHPLYDYGGKISHTSLLGYSDMEVVDYGAQTNANQGPFIAFALPSDAYTPDKNGVITISSVDVAAVLDWALTNYPKYYSNTIYLTELNLAEEAMTVSGTFTTTFASFEIQKTGSPVVYDPTFTDSFWTNGTMSSGAPLIDRRRRRVLRVGQRIVGRGGERVGRRRGQQRIVRSRERIVRRGGCRVFRGGQQLGRREHRNLRREQRVLWIRCTGSEPGRPGQREQSGRMQRGREGQRPELGCDARRGARARAAPRAQALRGGIDETELHRAPGVTRLRPTICVASPRSAGRRRKEGGATRSSSGSRVQAKRRPSPSGARAPSPARRPRCSRASRRRGDRGRGTSQSTSWCPGRESTTTPSSAPPCARGRSSPSRRP